MVPPDLRRQALGQDRRRPLQGHGPLDHVLELADVARPVVPLEQRHRLVRDAGHGLPHLLAVLREEVLGDERDVFAPLAQRGQLNRDDVDPVVEVLAKPPFRDELRQVLVGRRHHADVGADLLGPAHAAETSAPAGHAAA
jgi:hypothetical protein